MHAIHNIHILNEGPRETAQRAHVLDDTDFSVYMISVLGN